MKKFLTVSCFGCGGLILVVVLAFVSVGLIARGSADFAEASASYEPLTFDEAAGSADLSVGDAAGEAIEIPAAAAGRVHLLLVGVDEANIRRCEPGEDMSFDASYNRKSMTLTETMTEEDDGSWNYVIDMEFSGSSLGRLAQRVLGGRPSVMELCLPEDVPIEILVESAQGGLMAEFGGLWLPSVDVRLSMGGGMVNFDRPLREPADEVTIRASMGGGFVGGLGNASPAEVDLSNSMGGFTVDLSGEWKRDAQIRVGSESGGSTLIIPRSIRVVGVPDAGSGVDLPESTPTITFTPDTDFEEISIQWN